MLRELIDLVGGMPNALRGIVEGLACTAFLGAVYFLLMLAPR